MPHPMSKAAYIIELFRRHYSSPAIAALTGVPIQHVRDVLRHNGRAPCCSQNYRNTDSVESRRAHVEKRKAAFMKAARNV